AARRGNRPKAGGSRRRRLPPARPRRGARVAAVPRRQLSAVGRGEDARDRVWDQVERERAWGWESLSRGLADSTPRDERRRSERGERNRRAEQTLADPRIVVAELHGVTPRGDHDRHVDVVAVEDWPGAAVDGRMP